MGRLIILKGKFFKRLALNFFLPRIDTIIGCTKLYSWVYN